MAEIAEKSIEQLIREVGGLLGPDHFVLSSGRHSTHYVQKDAIWPHVDLGKVQFLNLLITTNA